MSTARRNAGTHSMEIRDLDSAISRFSESIASFPTATVFLLRSKALLSAPVHKQAQALHDIAQAISLREANPIEASNDTKLRIANLKAVLGTDCHGHRRFYWQTLASSFHRTGPNGWIEKILASFCKPSAGSGSRRRARPQLDRICSHPGDEDCDLRWPWEEDSPAEAEAMAIRMMRFCHVLVELELYVGPPDDAESVVFIDPCFGRQCLLHLYKNGVNLEPSASRILGEALVYAEGVPQDIVMGKACLEAAAEGLHRRPTNTPGVAAYFPPDVQRWTEELDGEADAKACNHLLYVAKLRPEFVTDVEHLLKLSKASAKRSANARLCYEIGILYKSGILWPPNQKKSVKWLQKAAGHKAKPSGQAALELSRMYSVGVEGVLEPNPELHSKWERVAMGGENQIKSDQISTGMKMLMAHGGHDALMKAAMTRSPSGSSDASDLMSRCLSGARRQCGFCSQLEVPPSKLKDCAGCRRVLYCGKECQRNAWKAGHNQECMRHQAPAG